MSDTTRWDKRAKALRYKWDKQSFHRTHWDKLDRKEKDYWRGRVHNNMLKIKLNTLDKYHPHRSLLRILLAV